MKKAAFFLFLAFLFLVSTKAIAAGSLPDFASNGSGIQDILEKVTNFLSNVLEPLKTFLRAVGNLLIWILELIVKLVQWLLSYLD